MVRYIPHGFRDLFTNTTFVQLFSGRVITDTGDSLYYIGTMWLVWDLTGSPFYTGLAGALVQLPNVFRFLLGPLVDQWQLRRILLGTQLINGVGVLVVPFAALTGQLSIWIILALIPILNFVNNFVYPAQNAALPRIVDDEQLIQANSLFSTSITTVDMAANAVAGALIAAIGAIALFVVDAATFAVAACLFVGVSVPTAEATSDEMKADGEGNVQKTDGRINRYWSKLCDGFTYVQGSVLMPILLGGMIVNFVSYGANAVLPAFADSFAGPAIYGGLLAAFGAGNLVGTSGAFLVDEYPFGQISIGGFAISGGLWLLAVGAPGAWLTIGLLFTSIIPIGAFNVMLGSMIQSAVDNTYLGRVSSLMTSLVTLMMPAGALLGGTAAGIVGSRTVMYGTGVALVFLAVLFFAHPRLRSLPPIADVDESALGLGETTYTNSGNIKGDSGSSTE